MTRYLYLAVSFTFGAALLVLYALATTAAIVVLGRNALP